MELVDYMRQKLESRKQLFKGATLVVGVSGGVDSVSLLKLLVLLAPEYDLRLIVAYFHHQLRRAANKEAMLVKDLAEKFGLKFVMVKGDVKRLAQRQKLTIEEAGRMWRYVFLQQVAMRYKADLIVTAHTADDQVETVIMNWLRGAGVRGLAGMKELENKIWRPLLEVPKAELKKFAKEQKLKYREDASNKQLCYTRNRIRQELIPFLAKFNPNINVAMLRAADTFTGLETWLDYEITVALKKVVISKKPINYVNLRIVEFKKLAPYLQNEILLWAVETVRGSRQDYKKVHLEQMMLVVNSPKKVSHKQLPGKLLLQRNRDKITISRIPCA